MQALRQGTPNLAVMGPARPLTPKDQAPCVLGKARAVEPFSDRYCPQLPEGAKVVAKIRLPKGEAPSPEAIAKMKATVEARHAEGVEVKPGHGKLIEDAKGEGAGLLQRLQAWFGGEG